MSTKILDRAEVKAVQTQTDRTIEFYAIAFSRAPDLQGDIIAPGAADAWLKSFYAQGRPLPISFAHAAVKEASDPFAIVGYAPADPEHVFVDDYGLRVRATLDVETNETAAQVYSLAKRGIVKGASVAYFVPPGGEKRQKDGSTLITKMEILEAGPCLDPANPDAYVVEVKSLGEDSPDVSITWGGLAIAYKAGRKHSKETTETIRGIIQKLLDMLDVDVSPEGTKDNAEEPTTANADDPEARIRAEIAAAVQEVTAA